MPTTAQESDDDAAATFSTPRQGSDDTSDKSTPAVTMTTSGLLKSRPVESALLPGAPTPSIQNVRGPPRGRRRTYRRALLPVPARGSQPTHAVFGTLLHPEAVASYHVYGLTLVDNNDENGFEVDDASAPNQPDAVHSTPRTTSFVPIDDDECGDGEASTPLVEAIVQLGHAVDGHPGVVHGGILALLIDDVLGFAYSVVDPNLDVAYTANLNVNYRAPVPSGSTVAIRVSLLERTDRKLVFSCQVLPCDTEEDEGDNEEEDRSRSGGSTRGTSSNHVYCDATSVYVIPRATAPSTNRTALSNL